MNSSQILDLEKVVSDLSYLPQPARRFDARVWAALDDREIVFEEERWLAKSRRAPYDECVLWRIGLGDWAHRYIPKYTASFEASRTITNWVLITASDIAADGLAYVKLGDPTQHPVAEADGCHERLSMAMLAASLRAVVQEKSRGQEKR